MARRRSEGHRSRTSTKRNVTGRARFRVSAWCQVSFRALGPGEPDSSMAILSLACFRPFRCARASPPALTHHLVRCVVRHQTPTPRRRERLPHVWRLLRRGCLLFRARPPVAALLHLQVQGDRRRGAAEAGPTRVPQRVPARRRPPQVSIAATLLPIMNGRKLVIASSESVPSSFLLLARVSRPRYFLREVGSHAVEAEGHSRSFCCTASG